MANKIDKATIDWLRGTYTKYEGQIKHQQTIDSKSAETVPAGRVLPQSIANKLDHGLYTHQAEAIESLRDGENVTIATPTSSGKTWVYTLYFALKKQREKDTRALFLYPTKALSADQEKAINDLLDDVGVDSVAETYDGDTKKGRKPKIRENRDVIISNFAAINYYLNDHTKWADLYDNIDLVVIDESHSYTGVQGMHVSWILRRLRRIIQHYGSNPQFVCSSATIGNPKEHSKKLVGEDFSVIETDGSPRGEREIAFWKPPETDVEETDDDEQQVSATTEVANVATHLGLHDVQTLSFLRSRQGCEVATKRGKRYASRSNTSGYAEIKPYHAALNKETRKEIENRLKQGEIDTVCSTNALELGIDIGSVDATVLGGYPGTRQSFWQQAGRSGRGTDDALSIFVTKNNAMDEYILNNPGFLLEDDVEDAVVSIENNSVYAKHILCASNEIPITESDTELLGPTDRLRSAINMWNAAGKITGTLSTAARYAGSPRPQSDISLYSTTDIEYDVRCSGAGNIDIEPIQKERAYRDFHPGALFLHDGVEYEVLRIEEDRRQPYIDVERVHTNERTITLNDKSIRDIESNREINLGNGFELHAGMGTVVINYDQYRRVPIYEDDESDDSTLHSIDLPPINLRTQMMWVKMPVDMQEQTMNRIPQTDQIEQPDSTNILSDMDDEEWTFSGGLHGAEHGMIKMAPLELRLDNSDMGGLSTPHHPEVGSPVWFIHDGVEGGVGFSHSVFDNFEDIAKKTKKRVNNCDCGDPTGCPSCLMSSQCGNDNEPLHKKATTTILDTLTEQYKNRQS